MKKKGWRARSRKQKNCQSMTLPGENDELTQVKNEVIKRKRKGATIQRTRWIRERER
jgi:hypothetical protein